MLVNKLIADVEARAGVSKVFQIILGASILTNILLAGVLLTMDKTVRTVFVPPEITKTFWVDGRTIAPEYLEQMGTWAIGLFATVSPTSADYQASQLLKYAHPSVYGDLAVRFKAGANRLKQENLSRIFFPREVRISDQGKAVALIGIQQTWIGGQRIPGDEVKAYLAAFDYDGSRTYLKELRETNAYKPFDAAPASITQPADSTLPQQQPAQQGLLQQSGAAQPEPAPVEQGQPIASSGALPPPPSPNSEAARDALQTGSVPVPANQPTR